MRRRARDYALSRFDYVTDYAGLFIFFMPYLPSNDAAYFRSLDDCFRYAHTVMLSPPISLRAIDAVFHAYAGHADFTMLDVTLRFELMLMPSITPMLRFSRFRAMPCRLLCLYEMLVCHCFRHAAAEEPAMPCYAQNAMTQEML